MGKAAIELQDVGDFDTWPEAAFAAQKRIQELEAALRPFADYAAKRDAAPLVGMGDSVHCIHTGTEHEAEITLTHCRHARQLLMLSK